MDSYITVQGDTFDRIAKQIYGNEKLLQYLIDANPEQMGTVIFQAGQELNIPELPQGKKAALSPAPWRR